MNTKKILVVVIAILSIAIIGVTAFAGFLILNHQGQQQATPTPIVNGTNTPGTFPTFSGSPFATVMPFFLCIQIIYFSGHPFTLRGAQIESPFNYIKNWESGKRPSIMLNSTVFNVMVHDWKMNVLRLPISNWIYAKDTTDYMSQLDQVVQEANTAGLYVVLDLHDNVKSGSPYGDTADMPKAENISFWQAIATHYKTNPMVMFDLYNEPKATNWQTWLHGGGTINGAKIVGFQDLVDAIRSAGAKQIIVVEPGSAGGGPAEAGGWSTIGDNTIKDPNIVYSLHVYRDISLSPNQQDAKWGPILGHYPIYYGEWAFLPNSLVRVQCRGVSHDQADGVVNNFLSYMESRHASWTAWSFTSHYLIQDWSTYAPTTLDVPWNCGDPSVDAGMGTLVKQYLTSHS